MNRVFFCILALILLATGCSREQPRAKVLDEGTKSRGTENPLEKTPLPAFRLYLNAFHFQSGEGAVQIPAIQVEEQHFCAKLSDEVAQCVLFDGTGESAHLTGVEYLVSRRMLDSFQPEEQKLWHSHLYAVRSGQTMAPSLPDAVERDFMKQFAGTYGKVWHTWNSQKGEQLPTGPPQLMMSFTADGQIKPELLQFRDERLQLSSASKRKARENIPEVSLSPNVDSWQRGEVTSVKVETQTPPRARKK